MGKLHSGQHIDPIPPLSRKRIRISGNPPLVRAFSGRSMGNLSREYQLIWHKYTDSTINWPYRYGWYACLFRFLVAVSNTSVYAISIYFHCGNLDVVGPINRSNPQGRPAALRLLAEKPPPIHRSEEGHGPEKLDRQRPYGFSAFHKNDAMQRKWDVKLVGGFNPFEKY